LERQAKLTLNSRRQPIRGAKLLIGVSFRHLAPLSSICAIPVARNLLAEAVPNLRMPNSEAPRDAL
jgi:uncharacterized membrane protein YraQ (UPF0718 family)